MASFFQEQGHGPASNKNRGMLTFYNNRWVLEFNRSEISSRSTVEYYIFWIGFHLIQYACRDPNKPFRCDGVSQQMLDAVITVIGFISERS